MPPVWTYSILRVSVGSTRWSSEGSFRTKVELRRDPSRVESRPSRKIGAVTRRSQSVGEGKDGCWMTWEKSSPRSVNVRSSTASSSTAATSTGTGSFGVGRVNKFIAGVPETIQVESVRSCTETG